MARRHILRDTVITVTFLCGVVPLVYYWNRWDNARADRDLLEKWKEDARLEVEQKEKQEMQDEAESQQWIKNHEAVADEVGDVDIEPNMTLGQLKAAVGMDPKIKNTVMARGINGWTGNCKATFGEGLITAECGLMGKDDEKPKGISARFPFRGSFCGVHIGDSAQLAATIVSRRCNLKSACNPKGDKDGYMLNLDDI
ncbi:MAG: hypothetical protein ACREAC_20615, partial [Blastocatellia bacterium]